MEGMSLAKDKCEVEGCKYKMEINTKLEAWERVKLHQKQLHAKKEDMG